MSLSVCHRQPGVVTGEMGAGRTRSHGGLARADPDHGICLGLSRSRAAPAQGICLPVVSSTTHGSMLVVVQFRCAVGGATKSPAHGVAVVNAACEPSAAATLSCFFLSCGAYLYGPYVAHIHVSYIHGPFMGHVDGSWLQRIILPQYMDHI